MVHIHQLREQLNQEGCQEQKIIMLADGAFDKATVWHLPQMPDASAAIPLL